MVDDRIEQSIEEVVGAVGSKTARCLFQASADWVEDIARYFLEFTQDESCGKCIPCRVGTRKMLDLLTATSFGRAQAGDLDRLEALCRTVETTSLCGLGQTAPNPVMSTLRHFRDEYLAHVVDKTCPAGVCKALLPVEAGKET